MLLSEASGSNVKVLSGSLRKIALCQNYSAKPSAKPRCCSAMEELQDSLFKPFFSFSPMSWIPEKSLLIFLGGALEHPNRQQGSQQGVPFSTDQSWTPYPWQSKATEPEETHPGSPERWLGITPIIIIPGHRQDGGSQ